MRLRALLFGAVLALGASCGDDDPTGRDAPTVEVAVTDESNANGGFGAFQPAEVRIRAGDRVRWTQAGSVPHTVTDGIRGAATGRFDEVVVDAGDTFEHTYDDAGTFPFHCRPHFGMDGVVVVEP